jgi:hypothetical protein
LNRMRTIAPQTQKYSHRWPARNLGCASIFDNLLLILFGFMGAGAVDYMRGSLSPGGDWAATENDGGAPTVCQYGCGGIVEPPVWGVNLSTSNEGGE